MKIVRIMVEITAGLLLLAASCLFAQPIERSSPSEHTGCLPINTVVMLVSPIGAMMIAAIVGLWKRVGYLEERGYKTLNVLLESSEKDRELAEAAFREDRSKRSS